MRAASTPLLGFLIILAALYIVFSAKALEDKYVATLVEARASLRLKGESVVHTWDLITSERVFLAGEIVAELNHRGLEAIESVEEVLSRKDFFFYLYDARNMLPEQLEVLDYRPGKREVRVSLFEGFPLVRIDQRGEMDIRFGDYTVTVDVGPRSYLLPINLNAIREDAERFLEGLYLPDWCVEAESREEAKEYFRAHTSPYCEPVVSRKGEKLFALVGVTCELPLRTGPYTIVLRLFKGRSANKCLGTDM